MTTELPGQRPEGKLIEKAQKADGRSIREIAPLAGITDARWRQLVKGWLKVRGDHVIEQIAPLGTLARMALVVGVTPDQLIEAGRPDAAGALVALLQTSTRADSFVIADRSGVRRKESVPQQLDEIDLIYASKSMTAEQKLKAIRQVLQLRAQAEQEAAAQAEQAMGGEESATSSAGS